MAQVTNNKFLDGEGLGHLISKIKSWAKSTFFERDSGNPLGISDGGTGLSSLPASHVIVGTGSDAAVTVLATPEATAETVVKRDSNGNISAGTFTGSLSGNASTAVTLQTAREINGTPFNGSANITTAKWGTSRGIAIADYTGSSLYKGAVTYVNGSDDVTLNLPRLIHGNLEGNAVTATTATQLGTTTIGASNQLVYLSAGTPTAGMTIRSGSTVPSDSLGNDGDIYFKY